jgi:hypothetical protein
MCRWDSRAFGLDHGAGHPLLFLDDAKAPNCRKNNGFKGLGNYSEWPKVAGAVIKAGHSTEEMPVQKVKTEAQIVHRRANEVLSQRQFGLDHGVGHPSDSCPRWKHLTH